VLNYSSDVSVRSWDYHLETAHVEQCHLIARLDLPLGIDAYDAFVEYIRRAHNPRYAFVCKQTTTRDFVKHFNHSYFLSVFSAPANNMVVKIARSSSEVVS
jgi:hypothetical protein